jgi:hypothetical protein
MSYPSNLHLYGAAHHVTPEAAEKAYDLAVADLDQREDPEWLSRVDAALAETLSARLKPSDHDRVGYVASTITNVLKASGLDAQPRPDDKAVGIA